MLSLDDKKLFAEKTALEAERIGWPSDFVHYFRTVTEIHKIPHQVKLYPFGTGQFEDDCLVNEFFKDLNHGRFLCIGSAIGIDQTNFLMLKNWAGVYCDPDPLVFPGLFDTAKNQDNIILVNAAITPTSGIREFYVSETQALSSVYNKLAGDSARKILINPITLTQLLDYVGEDFDYVQIDAEGLDEDLVKSIDWNKRLPRCKMVGIESGMFLWDYMWANGNYILTDITENNAYYRRLSDIDSNKTLING